MEAVIAFALVSLAGLMFYRLVERRHKILVGKIVVGLLLVVVAFVAYMWVSARNNDRRREALRRGVTITFLPDSSGDRNPHRSVDTVTTVSFRLCNKGSDTVAAVSFWPKTLAYGRSTEYDIVIQRQYAGYRSNEFNSDYIMPPRTCRPLTWSGEYAIRDTVVATAVTVTQRP